MQPLISIIIPTYNEEKYIHNLITYLMTLDKIDCAEIIVSDGGSQDLTLQTIKNDPILLLHSPQKGRAVQMNFAAGKARGRILYFLHADTIPPGNIIQLIIDSAETGKLHCLRYRFDSDKILLKVNSFFTRFKGLWAGGGDQSLIISSDLYRILGGFNNSYVIMEDFDLVKRAFEQNCTLVILPYYMLVSARKYDHNSWLKVQCINFITMMAWKLGWSQEDLCRFYQNKLKF